MYYEITPFNNTEMELFSKNPVGLVAEKILSDAMRYLRYAEKKTDIDIKDYKSEIIKTLAEKLPE